MMEYAGLMDHPRLPPAIYYAGGMLRLLGLFFFTISTVVHVVGTKFFASVNEADLYYLSARIHFFNYFEWKSNFVGLLMHVRLRAFQDASH